jgi:glutamyl/glutaminyl-tRNA synthetase
MADKEVFCWRFAVPAGDESVSFFDRLRGAMQARAADIGDFVLLRGDGTPTYHFAVVVDDHDSRITHVIRGEEHLSNTPKQELLYRALGWSAPEWIHIPMVLDAERHKLGKRSGAVSISSYRENGWSPKALVSYMATLSWSGAPADSVLSPDELARVFDIDSVALDSPIHDSNRMRHFGKLDMRSIPTKTFLQEYSNILPYVEDPPSEIDSDRLSLIEELLPECACRSELEGALAGAFLLESRGKLLERVYEERWMSEMGWISEMIERLSLLQSSEWSSAKLKGLLREFQGAHGLKGKNLYHTLRLALSGKESGAPVVLIMACLGRKNALDRLNFLCNFGRTI